MLSGRLTNSARNSRGLGILVVHKLNCLDCASDFLTSIIYGEQGKSRDDERAIRVVCEIYHRADGAAVIREESVER